MRQIYGKLTNELIEHTTPKTVGIDDAFPINTFRELVEQIAKLSFLNKDYLLFFRGQKNDYRNKIKNSTFYPTIYRGDYLTQQEVDYRFEKLNSASKFLVELFKEHKIEGHSELRRKRLIQWSILQHYEVTDTPLLDVTQSLRVACSFAQLYNDQKTAYIYVFGLPYFTNRISVNSEHDLINIRLLSISPPQALRPYFQEGYLVGTDDITNEYESKSEMDLNRRLIAKFEIPNNEKFWGKEFDKIPETALYPKNDEIEIICKEIGEELTTEIAPTSLGQFLKLWTEFEQMILADARKYIREVHNTRDALYVLMKYREEKIGLLKEFDHLRQFRNKLVHNPTSLSNEIVRKNTDILRELKRNY
ncbi:MAG TPA: FRG domain-containing protein [Flavobacterium sp.]|uniref:FRG domain-containing protein n=1 Tax=Flavobacterium sp. TaxID=239 RepID=UPI002DBBBA5F|nr:FRG domain-containing protein [Flavobacterium sp.]HEU4790167.1 FRG domain-containing protein [Flavobacterium sp.]